VTVTAGEASALLGVQLVPISGEGSHCWYTAVSRAKNLPGNEIQRLLRQALECIADAETLRRYHFDLAAGATSEEVQAVKAAYLSSQDFLQMQWGGAKEMFLLSHALGGALRFLCVTDAQLPFQRRSAVPLDSQATSRRSCCCTARTMAETDPSRITGTPSTSSSLTAARLRYSATCAPSLHSRSSSGSICCWMPSAS